MEPIYGGNPTSEVAYVMVPTTCTVKGWTVAADGSSPTCTIRVAGVTGGTALPTSSNYIDGGAGPGTANASPYLSTGNWLYNSSAASWSNSGALSADELLGFFLTVTNSVAKQITVQLLVQ